MVVLFHLGALSSFTLVYRSESIYICSATFECSPCDAVVPLSVATLKGGIVFDDAFDWPIRDGVVHDAACNGAFVEVTDVLPAESDVDAAGVGSVKAVDGIALDGLAGETNAGKTLGSGEDDAAVGVVPSVGFVLAHDGELDAVDGE